MANASVTYQGQTPYDGDQFKGLCVWKYTVQAKGEWRFVKGSTWGLDFPNGTAIRNPDTLGGPPESKPKYWKSTTKEGGEDAPVVGHTVTEAEVTAKEITIEFVAECDPRHRETKISVERNAGGSWTRLEEGIEAIGPIAVSTPAKSDTIKFLAVYEGWKAAALLSMATVSAELPNLQPMAESSPDAPLPVSDTPA